MTFADIRDRRAPRMPSRRLPRSAALVALPVLGVVGAAVLGALIAGFGIPARPIQVVAGLALAWFAYTNVDRDAAAIPHALRPTATLLGSLVVGSVSVSLLTDAEYTTYATMWALQLLGFALGYVAIPSLARARIPASASLNPARLATLAYGFWVLCALAALAFFKLKGIPALGADVEQARVDASSTGTGYLRLIANMTTPTALLLIAVRHRFAMPVLIATVLLLLGFGNRIPVVYLVFPLVVMAAVTKAPLPLTRRPITSGAIFGIGALLIVLVGALGTYRIASQKDFANYAEYRKPLADHDYAAVSLIAITHYAAVVPANMVLTKRLVDQGRVPQQWGATYATLFTSALPGRQLSPDLLIKQASGKDFVGGGTPPTLAGEGYMNFRWIGVVTAGLLAMLLARWWGARVEQAARRVSVLDTRVVAVIFGYVLTWTFVSQVGGLAGAATTPLAGFLTLLALRRLSSGRATT
jgi:hypothetical protein